MDDHHGSKCHGVSYSVDLPCQEEKRRSEYTGRHRLQGNRAVEISTICNFLVCRAGCRLGQVYQRSRASIVSVSIKINPYRLQGLCSSTSSRSSRQRVFTDSNILKYRTVRRTLQRNKQVLGKNRRHIQRDGKNRGALTPTAASYIIKEKQHFRVDLGGTG